MSDPDAELFRAANLEIVGGGKTLMVLHGVKDPESFRHAILNVRNAWAPDKVKSLPFIAASSVK